MSRNSLHGVLAPVVTPFRSDLSPDPERFVRHCKWLLSRNCGLAVFGTNSEANSLATKERETLLEALVAAGVDPARMMPGTGCCSITETVRLTSQAVRHGCAGVLMLPPFYYKDVTEEGLYRYFSEVVQSVGNPRLRIYLYHIPPVAIVGITPKLVERLLNAYPNIIAGMKDSSGDWNNTKTFLEAFGASRTGSWTFDVFVGSETFLLANMRNGGAGTISATANVNPSAIYALYAACVQQRTEDGGQRTDKEDGKQTASPADGELEGEQARLNAVRAVFARQSPMISAMKEAIAIYTNDPGWARVRPPLVELTREQSETLEAELKAMGFTLPR